MMIFVGMVYREIDKRDLV